MRHQWTRPSRRRCLPAGGGAQRDRMRTRLRLRLPAPASASASAPDALAARYERDGYLAPFRVLAPEEAGGCRQRMQALRKERPKDAATPNPALDPLPRRGEGAAEAVVA